MNDTVLENSNQGTLNWQMTSFQFDYPSNLQSSPLVRGLRSSVIEGYASRTSVYTGESIDLMVSVNPACPFIVDIYRLGYYGGAGGRFQLRLGPFAGEPQPMPMETVERQRDCHWKPCASLRIPDDWASGVYLAKLSRNVPRGEQSYIIFVVKRLREAEVLVQVSDLTWQAYNKWPTNSSIYDDGSGDVWYTGPNVRVGFNRPYAKYCQHVDSPLSCGSGEYLLWEFPLAYWLEAEGYDVAYCSNLDLHEDAELIRRCKVFISAGHDEYWTRRMYEHAVSARDAGVSLLFLSGNSVHHEIHTFDEDAHSAAFRAFSRKRTFLDEHELMGSSTFGTGWGDWIVTKPDHWIYEGTGMKTGDSIPGLIGWEYHGAPFKETDSLEIVAQGELNGVQTESPLRGFGLPKAGDGKHAAVIYRGPRNNWIFNAGTIWWSEGLSSPPGHTPAMGSHCRASGPDPRVQQMTRNLLKRCLGGNAQYST